MTSSREGLAQGYHEDGDASHNFNPLYGYFPEGSGWLKPESGELSADDAYETEIEPLSESAA